MGKEKKKLGIKTTRYFTKNCTNCGFEYPNWFTNCPKCGAAWDDSKAISVPKEAHKKTIKIVVKITEETFNKSIVLVNLIFSADQGKTWYQMEMEAKLDYYIAEIKEVPIGSVIIYYVEVSLEDGERVIENNDGKYFFYKVGVPIEENNSQKSTPEQDVIQKKITNPPTKPQQLHKPSVEIPQQLPKPSVKIPPQEAHITKEMVAPSAFIPLKPLKVPERKNSQEYRSNDITIFGKPQTQIDTDLKVCIHCKSKIKKMWSTCPICGKTL